MILVMDENTIAENLKQNITAESYTSPTPAPATDGDSAFQSSVSLGDPLVSMRLNDYFDLGRADRYSEERQHQLKTVLEWAAAHAQSNDVMEILNTLQRKEMELGSKPLADRLNRVYRLAKLEAQANFVNLEMRQIYGS